MLWPANARVVSERSALRRDSGMALACAARANHRVDQDLGVCRGRNCHVRELVERRLGGAKKRTGVAAGPGWHCVKGEASRATPPWRYRRPCSVAVLTYGSLFFVTR